MATWFSDHYSTGLDQNSLPTLPSTTLPHAGIRHSRVRRSRASATLTAIASADNVRMLTMKSSDRLYGLYCFTDGGLDATDLDIGVYLSGDNHDGAVVDADVFGDAVNPTSPITAWDAADILDQDGAVVGDDRGKELWALASLITATYTTDPKLLFDIAITFNGANTVAGVINLVADYTAGD